MIETAAHGLDPRTVMADLRTMLADWQLLMVGEPVQARRVARQLIVGKLELVPDQDLRGFTFTGTGTLEAHRSTRVTAGRSTHSSARWADSTATASTMSA